MKLNLLICVVLLACASAGWGRSQDVVRFTYEGNPLVRHIYTADPSARVFGDRLYVYTSHDQASSEKDVHFDMLDWHVFSTSDLKEWTDHGVIFSLKDIAWASKQAWAPDCVQRNGKYFFYFPVEQTKIGVAVGESPTGPFRDALGKALIDKAEGEALIGREPIDPAILIDDDGQAYMYFGCRDARAVRLKDNMTERAGPVQPVVIHGNEGDTQNHGGWYGEGPWMLKRAGIYYFIYSNGWGSDSTLVYATGTNATGPFQFQGQVMPPAGAGTSHGSIVEFKGRWLIFYHDKSLSNDGKRRSVCFAEITFAPDGKINPPTRR